MSINFDLARKTIKQYLGSDDVSAEVTEQILDLVHATGFVYLDPTIKARLNWKLQGRETAKIKKLLKDADVKLDASRMADFLAYEKSKKAAQSA